MQNKVISIPFYVQFVIKLYVFLFFFFPFLSAQYVQTLKGEIHEHSYAANINKIIDNGTNHCVYNALKIYKI